MSALQRNNTQAAWKCISSVFQEVNVSLSRDIAMILLIPCNWSSPDRIFVCPSENFQPWCWYVLYFYTFRLIVFTPQAVAIVCAKHTFLRLDTTATFSQRFEAAVVRCRELGVFDAVRNAVEARFKDEHIQIYHLNRSEESKRYTFNQLQDIIRENSLRTLFLLANSRASCLLK